MPTRDGARILCDSHICSLSENLTDPRPDSQSARTAHSLTAAQQIKRTAHSKLSHALTHCL